MLGRFDQIDEGVFDLCLLDFGSAAAGDEAGAVASSNTTVAYAAPELLDGSARKCVVRPPSMFMLRQAFSRAALCVLAF
ncbi:MAG: hypothetical protein ACLT98_04245 [Eggerthellaceae bacterium]